MEPITKIQQDGSCYHVFLEPGEEINIVILGMEDPYLYFSIDLNETEVASLTKSSLPFKGFQSLLNTALKRTNANVDYAVNFGSKYKSINKKIMQS